MTNATPDAVAREFADHRRRSVGFSCFPGAEPETLESAYAIQNAAIALWDKPIAGWKVGRITGELEQSLGENRFLGPLFADTIWAACTSGPTPFPCIAGGFAALEAELVAVIASPDANEDCTPAYCASLVKAWHIGIEVAGSPLATIDTLSPLVSIAAFGNNVGLILGPRVDLDGAGVTWNDVQCTVNLSGKSVGPRAAGLLPGGPLAAITFAIRKLHALGHAIPEGTLISTGAITGVHAVHAGMNAEALFEPGGALRVEMTAL